MEVFNSRGISHQPKADYEMTGFFFGFCHHSMFAPAPSDGYRSYRGYRAFPGNFLLEITGLFHHCGLK